MVDTLGLLLVCIVHSAGVQDTNGARPLLSRLSRLFGGVSLVWADQGYKRGLIEWAKATLDLTLEVVARPRGKGFQVVKRRWVVERTFAWLSNYRIHAKDYCHNPQSSEASVYAASVNIMIRKLCPKR